MKEDEKKAITTLLNNAQAQLFGAVALMEWGSAGSEYDPEHERLRSDLHSVIGTLGRYL